MNTDLFPVAILSGGLATRLRPLTEKIPKALIEINGTPFILHQLGLLKQKGIKRVVICAGYLGEMLEAFLSDGNQLGLDIQYSYDGATLLGTGGAIKKALPLLGENFFVLYGDSYLPNNYAVVQSTFIKNDKEGLMTVFHNQGQWDKSNVEFNDGQIIAYNKAEQTSTMKYIDYGLGVFNERAFAHFPDSIPFDLAHLYQKLLQLKQLSAHPVEERFYEVGSFAGIEELGYYLARLNMAG